jgi:hypothetical protein
LLKGILTDEEIQEKYPSYIKFDVDRVIIMSHGYSYEWTKRFFYKRFVEDMSGLKDYFPSVFMGYREALNQKSISDSMSEFEFYQKWLYKYLFGDKSWN